MSAAAWVPPAVPGARRCPRGAAVPLHRAGRKSPSRGRDPESPRQAAVSDCLLVRPPRMEFLVLFLFYLAVVLTSVVLLCVCSKTPRLQGLGRRGAQVFSCVIPERLQRAVQRLLRYLFRTRNYSFLVVHLAVQAMVYTEYTSEIFGYCQELEFPLYYLLQPYLLLAVNLVFFTLTCVTNPGTVTRGNESALLQVYEFDDVMFPKNARCATCDLRKPARSKHCLPVPGLPEDRPAAGLCRRAEHPPGRLPVLRSVPGCHQPDHLRVVQTGLGPAPALPPCGPAPSLPEHSLPWAVEQPPGDISTGCPRL
ncbi:palmitoyltransferase ZDHHC4 isoform X4 [Lepus europaeus]|uniref:palmitoyltransferase ZDHHC4 isoform X4 n=1 Tax=Lepus europaeus TaxID=9983 RepID=UPI002B483365|nr:palmitoyltransferase ZDHHC4 isoform X4 [Lepus europaeus]